MPTVSNVRAEPHYWPAVPEQVWDSIREEFTLPTAANMETHFRSLGEPEGIRRTVRVFLSGLLRLALLFTAVGLRHPLPVVTP